MNFVSIILILATAASMKIVMFIRRAARKASFFVKSISDDAASWESIFDEASVDYFWRIAFYSLD